MYRGFPFTQFPRAITQTELNRTEKLHLH